MSVTDQHKEYSEYINQVNQVRDCVDGARAIKARSSGKAYLPMPSPGDTSQENADRYSDYKTRANFVNFTAQTKDGMVGMVFRKPLEVELHSEIEYLLTNADGGGLTIEQMAIEAIGENIEAARYGLLVDYPESEEGLTKAEIARLELQASILAYNFESIINWRTTVIGSAKKLSLVVLEEDIEVVDADGFGVVDEKQYRVLRLTDGIYTQQLYDEGSTPKGEEFTPRKFNGESWDTIPFKFIGALNNDETVDKSPLYDISEVNIAHYRNSADFEESAYQVGQPTPVIAGLTDSWVKENMKGGVMLGSRSAILLPEGGAATLLQAESNSMPMEGMEKKEAQMIKLGARIIQDSSGNETAEAARIRFGGQNSQLEVIVVNTEDGFKAVLEWAGEFMGGDGEIVFNLNREFYDKNLDAQQVMALIQLSDRGDITNEELRGSLRRANWITKSDDEIDEENESNGFNLEGIDNNLMPAQPQANDGALVAILERLSQPIEGQVLTSGPQSAPSIIIEAITIQMPEGMITFPENMVSVEVSPPTVTVEAAQINVEAPNITVEGNPVTVVNDKPESISIETDENGDIIGAKIDG